MGDRVRELLRCGLPIQLAPMGSVSATAALPLAVARAGGHGMYPDAVVSSAFNAGMPQPGSHRVLRSSIEAAERLTTEEAGVVRLAGAEIPVPRFGAQPPTRESTGAIEAMPFYAGQSAGAVHGILPAAEIVAELARGLP